MKTNDATMTVHYSYMCAHEEHALCTQEPERAEYDPTKIYGCRCSCHFVIEHRSPGDKRGVLTELGYALWTNQPSLDDKSLGRLIKKFLSTVQPSVYDDEVDALVPVFRNTINKPHWSMAEFRQEYANVKVIEQPTLI